MTDRRVARRAIEAMTSRPWAMTREAFETMLAIASREHDPQAIAAQLGEELEDAARVTVRNGIATVPIVGPLFRYANLFTEISGATSYEVLATNLTTSLESDEVRAVLLQIDSPGGELNGTSDLAQLIFNARGSKPIIAHVSGFGASAAYWIASAADRVIASDTALLGSIGVIMADHRCTGEGCEEVRVVSSQSPKKSLDLFDPDGQEQVQTIVDDLAAVFIDSVAKHRGVTVRTVLRDFGQGDVLIASKALAARMIDEILPFEEAHARLAERVGAQEPATIQLTAREPITTGPAAVSAWASHLVPHLRIQPEQRTNSEDTSTHAEPTFHVKQVAVEDCTCQTKEPVVMEEQEVVAVADHTDEILELCDREGIPMDQTRAWIKEGLTADQVGRKILDFQKGNKPDPVTKPTSGDPVPLPEMSSKEVRQYSLARAILALHEGHFNKKAGGLEFEVHEAISKTLGREPTKGSAFILSSPDSIRGGARQKYASVRDALEQNPALLHPTARARMMNGWSPFYAAPLDTGTAAEGQEWVFERPIDFIDFLFANLVLTQLGATMLTGLRDDVALPRQATSGGLQWLGETGTVVEQTLTTGVLQLTPNYARNKEQYSRGLLRQATEVVGLENVIRRDIAMSHATGIEEVAIEGGGANEPTGILQTAGVQNVPIGANGGALLWTHIVQLEQLVAEGNAERLGSLAYLTTPGVRREMKETEKATNTARFLWDEQTPTAPVNGRSAAVTTSVPSDLTKGTGTALHAMVYGSWPSLIIGEWGVLEIQVDPFTAADTGEIVVRSFQMIDVGLRYTAAFAHINDIVVS